MATCRGQLSKPTRFPLLQRPRLSRLDMNQDDNNEEQVEDDDGEFNEDDVKTNLNKISWLPSVKLGKQPYNPASFGQMSRKESKDGDSYERVDGSSIGGGATPGYRNIEILPVLPMAMVHGLEGISMDAPYSVEDESMESSADKFLGPGTTSYYGTGVWEEGDDPSAMLSSNTLGPLFSGTSSYLPHTKGHVFTVAEPRYKKLYDDLLRMGNYYGMKRERAMRRAKAEEKVHGADEASEMENNSMPLTASLPDPDEKRRFIVTAMNPAEDGVFAEYGLLFELKDLDEVAAVASYEMGGGEEGMALEELQDLVETHAEVHGYDDAGEMIENGDVMDILLRTHYEATHDVVGRVKIHRFVNPDCLAEGPEGEDYLMAEATILDVIDNDRVKMLKEHKSRAAASSASQSQEVEGGEQHHQSTGTSLTAGRKLEAQATEQAVGEVAKAVARIKEELRSSVGEAFKQQQQGQQLDSESIKDKLRAALDTAPTSSSSNQSDNNSSNASSNRKKAPIPLGPKGIYVERRSDDSLTKEERALRESFTKLVALQHELKEECRFTRVSVQTFGVGPVGVWLSAAAWSQFVEKRLDATFAYRQSDLQENLVEYMANRGQDPNELGEYLAKYAADEDVGAGGGVDGETIDFDDLSPKLQQEFQMVQARATEELGPLALERAIQMQRIVQAESYIDRLDLLRECVDNERRRLEAKKMLLSLASFDGDDASNDDRRVQGILREEARSLFERLISTDNDFAGRMARSKDHDEEAFQ